VGAVNALLADLPVTVVALLTAVALTVSSTLIVVMALARRRRREAQEVVLQLEEMRSGRMRTRLDLDARSPFAPIAESANRLGQELGLRWSRADAAHEGFHALQEAARGYGVIATDADGDLRSFSLGAVQLFGWEEDAVVGRNASLLFDDASWKELLPKLARKSLRERGVETRALMARRDGARFHARLFVRVLRGHGDETSGFLLVVEDVSDRVRVETELRAAETRSRGILEELPSGVALVTQGRIAYANKAMRTLLDVTEAEVAGFALRDRIATAQVLVVQEALSRIESAGNDAIVETSVTLLDAGGSAAREARFIGLAHTHEGRPAVLVLLRDESAEARRLRSVSADEARLNAVLDAWDDAIVLVEDDAEGGRVRVANRAFVSLFALSRAEVAGATEAELLRSLRGGGEEGIAAAAVLAASAGGPASDQLTTPGRALALWAAPLAGARDANRLRMLAVRDVTAQQSSRRGQAEEIAELKGRNEAAEASYAELRALHDELSGRRLEADRLNAELRTLDGMKSDLLANVSHELQTPLVSIRGYTEMILKGRLGAINDEQRKGLSLSLKNIDRLIGMIDNLLAFARADRGSGAMTITNFPLSAVVDEALGVLGPRIESKSLKVTRDLPDPPLLIRADRDKILQVFLNLIGNAVKFSHEHGTIAIAARVGKPGFALVQVRDKGIGIAKDELEKIFDRFHQAGADAGRDQEGTGIGLAIVRNILRLHGCSVRATSDAGEGTVLSFTLPLAEGRAEAQPEAQPEPPEIRPPSEPPADARPRLRIIRRG
jgi:PAS domain S-box-containing protein